MPINYISEQDVDHFIENGYKLNDYQRIATKTAVYPGQDGPVGLMYVALKGAGEAGEFAEHVGKAMRDDDFGPDGAKDLTADRHEKLVKEVGDQLWYLSAKCNELGISLAEAALINLKKLKDRSERNKLQGSGDDR